MSSSIHDGVAPPIAGRAELPDIEAKHRFSAGRSVPNRAAQWRARDRKSRLLLHAASPLVRRACSSCAELREDAEMTPFSPFVEVLRDLRCQRPDLVESLDQHGLEHCRRSRRSLPASTGIVISDRFPSWNSASTCSTRSAACWSRPAFVSRSC